MVGIDRLLEFAGKPDDLGTGVFLPQVGQEVVDFGIVVADEVQFLGMGLAGVPDPVLVEVVSKPPAHDDGVEFPLVDEALEQDGPLVDLDLHLDADLLEVILDKGGDVATDLVAVVGQQGEAETLPLLHPDTVRANLPPGFIQKLAGGGRIVGEWFHRGVEEPYLRSEDPGRLHSPAIDDVLDHLGDIHGLSQGLPDPEVLEHGTAEIPADVVVPVAGDAEEVEAGILLQALHGPGADIPEIDLLGLEGELEGEGIGQDAEDDRIEPWGAEEIVGVLF